MSKLRLTAFFAALMFPALSLHAAIVETFTYSALNQFVPDGNPAGLITVQSIQSQIDTITSIQVSVDIGAASGLGNQAFNGDLYVYLQHGSAISILLNRVGVTGSNAFGYGDNGLTVTFADTASSDIHLYRTVTVPALGAPLVGLWQPDGRATDPNFVLDSNPRTSLLGSFAGLDPDGQWTLFVADLSTGAEHVLNSFSIEITGVAVPEPGLGPAVFTVLLAACFRRKR